MGQDKAQKNQYSIQFPSEKLLALEYCMKEKGLNLDKSMTDFVLGLYEKHVPKIMKGYLDSGIETQNGGNQE